MTKEEKKKITKDEKDQKEGELLETLQRLQAEFENFRKRTEREKEEFVKFASRNLISELLPALDNFQRSLDKKTKDNHNEFVHAMEMVYAQLWDALKKEGLEQIESLDKPFDPELHQPLLQEESDKPANTVIEVLEQGYKMNGRVIRHARVKLAKEIQKDVEKNTDVNV
ncbi:nucleotide exchange factor GrpE [Candidatus Woesearchaeota archaeon]|nr:nucleotide exchange factor GrpE [Candidatus Woesearchaeota archaeon]